MNTNAIKRQIKVIRELRFTAENCSNNPRLHGDPMATYEVAETAVGDIETNILALGELDAANTDATTLNYILALLANSIAAFNAMEYVTQRDNLNLEASIHAAEACLANIVSCTTLARCADCLALATNAVALSANTLANAMQMHEAGFQLFTNAIVLIPSISVETFNASTIEERVGQADVISTNASRLLAECNAIHARVEAIRDRANDKRREVIIMGDYCNSNSAAGGAKCSRKTRKPRKLRKTRKGK